MHSAHLRRSSDTSVKQWKMKGQSKQSHVCSGQADCLVSCFTFAAMYRGQAHFSLTPVQGWLYSYAAPPLMPNIHLDACPPVRLSLNPSGRYKWLSLWWSPLGSRSLPTPKLQGGVVMSGSSRLSWWVGESLLCEAWLQEHGLTPQLQHQPKRPGTVALLIMQVLICVAKRVAGTCLIWTLQEWNSIRFTCYREGNLGALFL